MHQDIQRNSNAMRSSPRFAMWRSTVRGESPAARRDSVDIASDAPARKTNVGAQRWVIHRVRNCASGSGVPGFQNMIESVNTRPALKFSEAWSIDMSTMTKPRRTSIGTKRAGPLATNATYYVLLAEPYGSLI